MRSAHSNACGRKIEGLVSRRVSLIGVSGKKAGKPPPKRSSLLRLRLSVTSAPGPRDNRGYQTEHIEVTSLVGRLQTIEIPLPPTSGDSPRMLPYHSLPGSDRAANLSATRG